MRYALKSQDWSQYSIYCEYEKSSTVFIAKVSTFLHDKYLIFAFLITKKNEKKMFKAIIYIFFIFFLK
jgi:hypothetical protein